MDKRVMKYNPAFLSPDELVASFVVRHAELDLILQTLRENTGDSNQHLLLIGPRGIGKTMLALRAAEAVRRDEELAKRWYPLVFSEESYQVTTPGEFWLEAIFHLGQKTDDPRWKAVHEDLMKESDEARLRERALAPLLDLADAEQKTLLLVVENLNMLLAEQMDDDDGWALRHTLLNEPRLMLLATATSRFDEIENAGKPMFELFRTITLEPLDEDDCRKMWRSASGEEPDDGRVRPIQILTGGNPRLVSIISTFGARMSFKELMADLMQLVDDHTEYFKSHLESLPPAERKAYLALVELWDPAGAREVAQAARLEVNKTSSFLRRLEARGAVVEVNGQGRKKLYQVAERLYNIYYLMRRRGAPSRRVRAAVNFIVAFYGESELPGAVKRIAQEACKLEAAERADHYMAYEQILRSPYGDKWRVDMLRDTPCEFIAAPDVPSSLIDSLLCETASLVRANGEGIASRFGSSKEVAARLKVALAFLRKGLAHLKQEDYVAAVATCDELLRAFQGGETPVKEAVGLGLLMKGLGLEGQEDYGGAIATYDELLERFQGAKEPEVNALIARALFSKGAALDERQDHAKAIVTYNELLERFQDAKEPEIKELVAEALLSKGVGLAVQRDYSGALASYDELVDRFGDTEAPEFKLQVAKALLNKGVELGKQEDGAGAIATYDELIERFGAAEEADLKLRVARALLNKGVRLAEQEERTAAVATCDELVGRFGDAEEAELKLQVARALLNKGAYLTDKQDRPGTIATYDDMVERFGAAEEVELKLPVAVALVRKGIALGELRDHAGAVGAYDDFIQRFGDAQEPDLKLEVGHALFHKGIELDALKDYEGAVATYDELVTRFGASTEPRARIFMAYALGRKASSLCEQEETTDAVCAWREASETLAEHPQEANLRKSLAWTAYRYRLWAVLPEAESCVREAVALEPVDADAHHTLASVLYLAGKKAEALEETRKYLSDRSVVEDTIEAAIDLFIGLAAVGCAKEALHVLRESPSADLLEPLVVGLRLYLGEDVKAAAEILEVGKDVVKRIEERRQELESHRSKQGQDNPRP